jgi:hypothetical protein
MLSQKLTEALKEMPEVKTKLDTGKKNPNR